jgi:hypothetical protein
MLSKCSPPISDIPSGVLFLKKQTISMIPPRRNWVDKMKRRMHGGNQLIHGGRSALTGMKTGEAKQVILKPEDGYGPSNQELFREIEKTKLPAGQHW